MADAQQFPCVGCGAAVSAMALRCPQCDRLFPAGSVITRKAATGREVGGRRPGTPPPPPPPSPDPPTGDPRGPAGWDEDEDPYLGTLLNGQYRVERRIGVGGMGAVYLATEEGMRRQVAVKVMMPRPGDPVDRQKRFQREAQAASKLAHPHIVTVHNFGRLKDGTLFLAMEYIQGDHLGEVLRHERPLAVERALRIAIQVADGLAEAHAAGIIHRDLKPDNIVLSDRRGQEVAKILDFGIAKVTDPDDDGGHTTRAGLVRGTPRYMSPEQARGDTVDPRTDIYSLGVILYYALTGDLPIQADTPFGYLHAHQHQAPPPLRKARPDLPLSASLEALVMRSLAKDPELRPATMAEVLAALRLEHAWVTGATPDPQWARVAPLPTRRPRAFPAVAGGAALATLVAAVWWFWPTDGPRGSAGLRQAAATSDTAAPAEPAPSLPTQPPPRLVEASAKDRPPWAGADAQAAPPGDDPQGGIVVIGSGGPAGEVASARAEAEVDAAERALERVLERFPIADLRLTLRGWIGDRRKLLDGKATYAARRLIESGPDASMDEVFKEWRAGQATVVTGIADASGDGALRLTFDDAYWERWRHGPADRPVEFAVVWVRGRLSKDETDRTVRRFSTGVRLAGITAVAPVPLIAWRGGDVRGALVHRVDPSSPAAKAGLTPGDLIQSVAPPAAPARIRSLSDLDPALTSALAEAQRTGDPVELVVRRPGEGDVTVTFRQSRPTPAPGAPVPAGAGVGGSIDE